MEEHPSWWLSQFHREDDGGGRVVCVGIEIEERE